VHRLRAEEFGPQIGEEGRIDGLRADREAVLTDGAHGLRRDWAAV